MKKELWTTIDDAFFIDMLFSIYEHVKEEVHIGKAEEDDLDYVKTLIVCEKHTEVDDLKSNHLWAIIKRNIHQHPIYVFTSKLRLEDIDNNIKYIKIKHFNFIDTHRNKNVKVMYAIDKYNRELLYNYKYLGDVEK